MIRFVQSFMMILLTTIVLGAFMVILVEVVTAGRPQANAAQSYFALTGARL